MSSQLHYERVTPETLPLALAIQHQVWPDEGVDKFYLDKSNHPDWTDDVNWLIYLDDQPIGITGIFTFDKEDPGYDDDASIWVDWFAILPAYRGKGYSKLALQFIIDYCKQLNSFEYLRLDTTYFPNRPAIGLYDSMMDLREEYTAEDTADHQNHYLIYTKSLHGKPLTPWQNRFLNLGLNSEGHRII